MESNIIKTISLDNNLTLVLEDLSRKISADASVVILKASIAIEIQKDLFSSEDLETLIFEDLIDKLGHHVEYIYKMERNMIMDYQKDEVLASLVDAFWNHLGQYISKPQFPKKLILKKYRDILKKRNW